MARKSILTGEHGCCVRIYKRIPKGKKKPEGPYYLAWYENDIEKRKSLGHSDLALAKIEAKEKEHLAPEEGSSQQALHTKRDFGSLP